MNAMSIEGEGGKPEQQDRIGHDRLRPRGVGRSGSRLALLVAWFGRFAIDDVVVLNEETPSGPDTVCSTVTKTMSPLAPVLGSTDLMREVRRIVWPN